MIDPRNDIAELIYTYGEMVDTGNFDGIGEMFAHAEITTEGFGEVRRGTSAVVAMYEATTRRYEDDGTPKTKHVMTNVIVQVDEDADTATSRSYFTVLQAVRGALALQPIVAGRYTATTSSGCRACGGSPVCTSSWTWSGTSLSTC